MTRRARAPLSGLLPLKQRFLSALTSPHPSSSPPPLQPPPPRSPTCSVEAPSAPSMDMTEVMTRDSSEPDEPRPREMEAGRGRRRRASSGSSPSAGGAGMVVGVVCMGVWWGRAWVG
jgi:hypothetical protein